MNVVIKGNTVFISFAAGDSPVATLPAGYSFERIRISYLINILALYETGISANTAHIFPPVNSKSPYILKFSLIDSSLEAEIRFTIEKFGQIPDADYFNSSFKPILVTGDDGKEYNVIPSDQFK
jgi:hypothetical protein